MAKKDQVSVPVSKYKLAIAKVFESENLVGKVESKDSMINIKLLYVDNEPKIEQIKQTSKQGLRIYSKSKKIKTIKGGRGVVIVSTPAGVMSGKQAKAKNLGGEVICEIW